MHITSMWNIYGGIAIHFAAITIPSGHLLPTKAEARKGRGRLTWMVGDGGWGSWGIPMATTSLASFSPLEFTLKSRPIMHRWSERSPPSIRINRLFLLRCLNRFPIRSRMCDMICCFPWHGKVLVVSDQWEDSLVAVQVWWSRAECSVFSDKFGRYSCTETTIIPVFVMSYPFTVKDIFKGSNEALREPYIYIYIYIYELLHVYTPSRALRSSSVTSILKIQQYKRKSHRFRIFSCTGPHIWNSLPQDLRHCSILSSFKAKLKTFLFSQYFRPN